MQFAASPTALAVGPTRWRLAVLKVELKWRRLRLALKDGFNPSQPRVPAGQADGGQWTDGGGGSFRVAQNAPRGTGSRARSGGGLVDATPGQLARLAVSRASANGAVARVREIDARWNPRPGLFQTVEGEIETNVDILRQAESRLLELRIMGFGPGLYSGESLPSRGPHARIRPAERRELDRIGAETGCHTCGTKVPGTLNGSFIFDHQISNALNRQGREQRGYPHCQLCSTRQGGYLRGLRE
jgi:hypothetical protein